MKINFQFALLLICVSCFSCKNKPKDSGNTTSPKMAEMKTTQKAPLKALIIDGENNHGIWPKTTMMMKDYLEETGLFSVNINRTAYTWQGPHYDSTIGLDDITELLKLYPLRSDNQTEPVQEPKSDPTFSPAFDSYDVIISNMGWKASDWSEIIKAKFEKYMAEGGGLIVVHAANNSWGDWMEYNKMIGIGGWGGRSTESGPYVYYDDNSSLHYDKSEGACGSHGPQAEFILDTRAPEHPIMKGLPLSWKHSKDELYDRLRGPAENMTVLATSYSDVEGNAPPWDKKVKGTGRHEPMLSAIEYGKGKIFHTALGHMDYSMECVGFITTLQRGAEWVATGEVTQEVPSDFPNNTTTQIRKWNK